MQKVHSKKTTLESMIQIDYFPIDLQQRKRALEFSLARVPGKHHQYSVCVEEGMLTWEDGLKHIQKFKKVFNKYMEALK